MKNFRYDATKPKCPSCAKQDPGTICYQFYCTVCKTWTHRMRGFCDACKHVYEEQHAYDMHKSVELT